MASQVAKTLADFESSSLGGVGRKVGRLDAPTMAVTNSSPEKRARVECGRFVGGGGCEGGEALEHNSGEDIDSFVEEMCGSKPVWSPPIAGTTPAKPAPAPASKSIANFFRPKDSAAAECGSGSAAAPEPPGARGKQGEGRGDYVLPTDPVKAPFKVHGLGEGKGFRTGPLWSVLSSGLTKSDLDGHMEAMMCQPNRDKVSAYGESSPYCLGALRSGRLYMPPHYALVAFPHDARARLGMDVSAAGTGPSGLKDAAGPTPAPPPEPEPIPTLPTTVASGAAASSPAIATETTAGASSGTAAAASTMVVAVVPKPPRDMYHESTHGVPMREGVAFVGKLWQEYPPQQPALDAWKRWRAAHPECPGGMLSLPCGHGKSVVSLAIAASEGKVTLILAHMIGLVHQWIEEAKRYVSHARVGYIIQDKHRVEDVDIIVASVASLASQMGEGTDQPPHIRALQTRVGFVILDEAHHGVAKGFARVMAHLPAATRLAVTATPRRGDGLFAELQYIYGPMIFRSFRRPTDCQVLSLRYVNPEFREKKRRVFNPKTRVCTEAVAKNLMDDALVADPVRNEVIVALGEVLVSRQQRRILVVTPLAAHVDDLAVLFEAALEGQREPLARNVELFVPTPKPSLRRRPKTETVEEFEVRKHACLQEWEDTGPHGTMQTFPVPLVGRVKEHMDATQRKLNYESAIVVATSAIVKEGISFNEWDTLFLTDAIRDPEQLVGRIQRASPLKKVPLVIDFFPPLSLYLGLAHIRRGFYYDENYRVHDAVVTGLHDMPSHDYLERFNTRATAVL